MSLTICTDHRGRYRYTEDLLRINGGLPRQAQAHPRLSRVSTPLMIKAWKSALRQHPDADFARYISDGLYYGFHIGVQPGHRLCPAGANMPSARDNPQIIEDYLQKELRVGNILGPFQPSDLSPSLHINRFGCIPKKHQSGKWRLITDLSFPKGNSVNDTIDPKLCSLSYTTVDEVAHAAMQAGKGSLMAKIDIKAAYRLVPVHPEDRIYLGMKWKGDLYVDGMLPFGLRSAPKIFTAIADALEWCIAQQGEQNIFHYLDDFLVLGPPGSDECLQYLTILERVCAQLGVPLAPDKKDGPTAVITFLGIIIDTLAGELRLPADKLERLLTVVTAWGSKRCCTKRELESLIGTLQHACKVIKPGRTFLRRAIALLSVAKQSHHHIRLNAEIRSDLLWWKMFASQWNGTAILVDPRITHDVIVTSDASGSWGCGAWCNSHWFQVEWDSTSIGKGIAVKELVPILIAATIWGAEWKGRKVLSHCDNSAVVAVVKTRSCKDKTLMQLLRCLFFLEAVFQFQLSSSHLPGEMNDLADDLSRNRLQDFKHKNLRADANPTDIPSPLLQWLLQQHQDWSSPHWMLQFSSFVKRE